MFEEWKKLEWVDDGWMMGVMMGWMISTQLIIDIESNKWSKDTPDYNT